MWITLLALAHAGPPFGACAVNDQGQLAFLSPRDGSVLLLESDAANPLAMVPMPKPDGDHVIRVNPAGGWLVGTKVVHRVSDDGAMGPAKDAQPAVIYAQLAQEEPAAGNAQSIVKIDRDDLGGTVSRLDASGEQTSLWRWESRSNSPVGLFDHNGTVYAITPMGIEVHPATGEPSSIPLPSTTTIGVCAAKDGPLHAVTLTGRNQQACVHRRDGEAWTQVVCVD